MASYFSYLYYWQFLQKNDYQNLLLPCCGTRLYDLGHEVEKIRIIDCYVPVLRLKAEVKPQELYFD